LKDTRYWDIDDEKSLPSEKNMSPKNIIKERIVTKEEAVFWMDGRGRWCNRHGPFEHPKIIAYFNSSIGMDSRGYFVQQILNGFREKVYFRYEGTPLFVVDIIEQDPVVLMLNTGRSVELDPGNLWIRNDHLCVTIGDEYAQFSEKTLIRMTDWIQCEKDTMFFCRNQIHVEIPEI
jgi:hypothetical protein